jgi:sulfur-oxidizing protein SoxX
MYFKFFIVFLINFYLFIYSTSANNNLSNYEIVNFAIPLSLTPLEGDPDNGRNIVISREGNCLACHIVPNISDKFQGNIGPSLAGVGNRYTIGELRLRLVDPYVISPTTLMPAFYKNKGLIRVDEKYIGKSILTAQQIEDVISWLITLKIN